MIHFLKSMAGIFVFATILSISQPVAWCLLAGAAVLVVMS